MEVFVMKFKQTEPVAKAIISHIVLDNVDHKLILKRINTLLKDYGVEPIEHLPHEMCKYTHGIPSSREGITASIGMDGMGDIQVFIMEEADCWWENKTKQSETIKQKEL